MASVTGSRNDADSRAGDEITGRRGLSDLRTPFLVDRFHETNRIGDGVQTHRPHPEEAHRSRVYPRSAHQVRKSATADLRCAVSKDGRWLGLACGRPSRRAQSFEARAPSGARAPQDDVRAPQSLTENEVESFQALDSCAVCKPPDHRNARKLGESGGS